MKADSNKDKRLFPWNECPTLELDFDRPPAERFRDVPEDLVVESRQLLEAVQREISGPARWLAPLVVLRTGNRFQAEIKGMARRVGTDWRDLVLANLSYELVVGMFACSTIALPTPTGPVLARNMDFWPERQLARASVLLRFHRGGKFLFAKPASQSRFWLNWQALHCQS